MRCSTPALGRALLVAVVVVLAASATPGCTVGQSAEPRNESATPASAVTLPPAGANVVLVVADDMRHDGLRAMATLNRLAAERGVTFSRAFATTPLCCPSRASIQTGLYAHHHQVLTNEPPLGGVERFDPSSTLATWAQGGGVRTGLVGRYLNGYASEDVPPGWDFWFALWQANEEYNNYFDYRVTDRGKRLYFGTKPEMYSTRVLGLQASRFLNEDANRPFLLLFTPRAPHSPATPDPLDSGTLKDLELPLPPSYDEADVRDKPAWIREHGRLRPREREHIEVLRRRQLESLLGLDRALAGIVEQLTNDGRLDRTWIIFTSDNGITLGEHRLGDGKACAYEECVRVPLVIVPPAGIVAPRTDGRLVANIDLAPTVAAIMGIVPASPTDGHSLLPLLDDPSAPWRDGLILEQWRDDPDKRWVALRTPDRKYVRYANGDEELYNQTADPYELDNLVHDGRQAEEKARMAARLDELLAVPPRH